MSTPTNKSELFDNATSMETGGGPTDVYGAAISGKTTRPLRRRRIVRRARSHHAHLNAKNRYALFDLGWLQIPCLTLNALRVLLVLSSHADSHRGTCFPSKETIAREAGIKDVTQVRKTLKKLEEQLHAVSRQQRPRASNLYWLQPAPDLEI
jgi:hypothetical protein